MTETNIMQSAQNSIRLNMTRSIQYCIGWLMTWANFTHLAHFTPTATQSLKSLTATLQITCRRPYIFHHIT